MTDAYSMNCRDGSHGYLGSGLEATVCAIEVFFC